MRPGEREANAGRSRGWLVLVVGPSGAGKDSLIVGARDAFADNSEISFPRRDITRPPGFGHEDHVAVTETEFRERQAQGRYSLSWAAHGWRYGVPRAIESDLAAGRGVVVNVSRSVIAEARHRLWPVGVVSVRVPPEILRRRLAKRGRESHAEIEARIARADAYSVDGPEVMTLVNDRSIEQGVAAFVALLSGLMQKNESVPAR